jgi:hypothetical protein
MFCIFIPKILSERNINIAEFCMKVLKSANAVHYSRPICGVNERFLMHIQFFVH